MSIPRAEVAKENQWNVEALYTDLNQWQQDLHRIVDTDSKSKTNGSAAYWPQIATFQGRLGDGPDTLKEALDLSLSIERQLEKLYSYARLRHDEEITDDIHKGASDRITSLVHQFAQEVSWMTPEILRLSDSVLNSYLKAPALAPYTFYLESIIRLKKHTLSPESEQLMALSGKALQAPQKAFSALNDADFDFGTVTDSNGDQKPLTHGTYGLYLRDQDRTLRQNAFHRMHVQYDDYVNTLCELLKGQVNKHLFNARARRYDTCLEASLFPKNIDTSVYHSLIKAVRNKLGALHKYMKLRKRVMGVSELHLYDVYVPLLSQVDLKMNYQQGEELVIQSAAPLGPDYQKLLRKGLQQERWVDRFENKNKRSGAYSGGCYDSHPYILMNYKDQLRDVFTLAHEAGHSMHSLLSRMHQPFHYFSYSIFVAEVASTFNEDLLITTLLQQVKTRDERLYLINQQIEDIRSTLFRQTMFAEFELMIHTFAENEVPITPALLREEYRKLNADYFGPDVVIDQEIEVEWARIPHFYYNFYVYQYATGISAALSLAERVKNGGDKEREAYLNFLKGGSSKYPIDLLRDAGVDMRSPKPVEMAIDKFSSLVDEMERELDSQVTR